MAQKRPTLLLVLDGWGHAQDTDWNAITRAPAENFLRWWQEWPHTLLSASGKEVGLPLGLMGNSEVGHMNMGAGRVVFQTLSRIDAAIADGSFQENGALRGAIQKVAGTPNTLHLFGLVGPGGVHAMDHHYKELLSMAKGAGIPGEQIAFHAILDGRDTAPTSAGKFMEELNAMLLDAGGHIASVCGRYYAMDRDTRWERTEAYWNCLVHGQAPHAARDWREALQSATERGESDEFVLPTRIEGHDPMQDGDAVISFNFRADRVRQISEPFLVKGFSSFPTSKAPKVHYVTMAQYRDDFPCPVAFPPEQIHSTFGEVVSQQGMRQLRCAETEKYAHVTFFFNGGEESVYPGEERILVPSPKVPTYDLQPEMSAPQVRDHVCSGIEKGENDLYVVNFANSDMVGHTGKQDAAEAAVRAVDQCLGDIVRHALAQGGTIAITADHGNAEQMRNPDDGEIHTAHTLNPVPLLLIGDAWKGATMAEHGVLADVAPTLLQTMSLAQPEVMSGRSLLQS